ncbi:MAG: DNA double-strand break repair nuclease NurA [Chloroflexaceae bacterium]|nr:DNA double-strand break repair nuclease NurA [Chloroflexaceae bacterium]NJO04588.1 DNA double-strand break repair nuclease NurA [Chloroflexaceae bacterium]
MSDSLANMGTAALPAAVLAAITDCAAVCRDTLRRLADEHDRLRAALDKRIRPAPDGPERRLCAVDGSHASVPTAGATFTAIAAAAVEDATLTDQEVLVQMLPPIEELDSLIGGLRCILELRLLARRIRTTTSGLFVLDGSFYSVLLEINRLLIRFAQDHRGNNPPRWWSRFYPLLDAFFSDEDWRLVLECRRVIAHSKQATAADDVITLAPHLSGTITDRSLWSNVLHAGEYSLPTSLIRADRPHLLTGYRSGALPSFQEHRLAIEHAYGQFYVIYYRPDAIGPAYRIELPAALIAREPLGAVLATFRSALRISTVQEPLPQFLADAICRQLQHALAATAEGARTTLQNEFDLALVQRYLGPYRTPR